MAGQRIAFSSLWSSTSSGRTVGGEILGGVFTSQDAKKFSFSIEYLNISLSSLVGSSSISYWDSKKYTISIGIGKVTAGEEDLQADVTKLYDHPDMKDIDSYIKLYRSVATGESIEDCSGFERALFKSTITFSKGYIRRNIRPDRKTIIKSSSTASGLGLIIHLGGMDNSKLELMSVPDIAINGIIEL